MKLLSEHIELRGLIRRVLEDRFSSETRRAWIQDDDSGRSGISSVMDELGLDEGFGGDSPLFGGIELGLIAFEAGRVLWPIPICEDIAVRHLVARALPGKMGDDFRSAISCFSSSVLASRRSCDISVSDQKASGSITRLIGNRGRGDIENSCIVAHARARSAKTSKITGSKTKNKNANGASRCVLFTAKAQGVTLSPLQPVDLTSRPFRVSLDAVASDVFPSEVSAVIESALQLVRSSEAAGLCAKVLEMTTEYVRTRHQFGVPVGGFQAIQHKLADAYAMSESLRAAAQFAAWSYLGDPSQRLFTARAAATYAAQVASKICEIAIQCHGGIGFTWEYDLHLYLRRAKVIESAFQLDESSALEFLDLANA